MDGSVGAQQSSCYEQPKRRRFSEPLKFLPVIFVLCSIFCLWFIYTFYHCLPLMQLGIAEHLVDEETRKRGKESCLLFHALVIMLLICYVRSILVHPGEVPDRDPQWEYVPRDRAGMDVAPLNLQETKKTGERRHCKWCGKYKPDRCHHCRVCKTCVLKMDHHCPWLYNCVGHFNYKYFFLLLFYSLLACHLMLWTMPESINNAMNAEVQEFHTLFMVCFGQALSLFLGTLVTLFFGFHIWLMMKAMTTIEFCEKSMPKKDSDKSSVYESSAYDIGIYGNIRTALGENPLFWLIPCDVPTGDGLSFVSDEKRLTVDMEAAHGMRRKTHQKTQRPTRASRSLSAGPAYGEASSGNQGRAYDYNRQ